MAFVSTFEKNRASIRGAARGGVCVSQMLTLEPAGSVSVKDPSNSEVVQCRLSVAHTVNPAGSSNSIRELAVTKLPA